MAFDSSDKRLKKNKGAYDTGSKQARRYKFKKKSLQDVPKSNKQKIRDKGYRKSKKRSNRTQSAREILAKTHGIKKAMARVDNKYVLDHEQITDIMDRMGFAFDDRKGKWDAAPKAKAEKEPEKKKNQNKNQKYLSKGKKKLTDLPDGDAEPALDVEEIDDPPISFKDLFHNQDEDELEDVDDVNDIEDEDWYTDLFAKGKDDEVFHITEREVMIFQGRYLLGLIWEEYDYSEYEINEAGELWGLMSRRDVIRAMTALELEWDEFNDIWVNPEGVDVFRFRDNHDDTKKTIIGRSLLANMNFLEFIQFDEETERPKMVTDSVEDKMKEMDFEWNDSEEIWEYTGKDHRADYGSLGHKRGGQN